MLKSSVNGLHDEARPGSIVIRLAVVGSQMAKSAKSREIPR